MQKVKNRRPDTYTLDHLDSELVSMTMIRSLPSSYAFFASSLQLLDKMDKESLEHALAPQDQLLCSLPPLYSSSATFVASQATPSTTTIATSA